MSSQVGALEPMSSSIPFHSLSEIFGTGPEPPPPPPGIGPIEPPTPRPGRSSIRARARASPFASSLPTSLAPSPTSSSVVTAALTSTPWITTEDGISVAPFFLAYSAIRARTIAWLSRLMSVVPTVAHWVISWRLISFAPASAAASAAGLGVGAQDRGLADLEHEHADREHRQQHDQQARQDLSAFPSAHRGTES